MTKRIALVVCSAVNIRQTSKYIHVLPVAHGGITHSKLVCPKLLKLDERTSGQKRTVK